MKSDFGEPVEEFEIQFIDGEQVDAELADAIGANQASILDVLGVIDSWEEYQKRTVIIAAGECGYAFNPAKDDPDSLEVDVYPAQGLRELAEQFVDDGLFGEIPERLRFYLDYDAIARDLSVDYTETSVAGERVVYRCS